MAHMSNYWPLTSSHFWGFMLRGHEQTIQEHVFKSEYISNLMWNDPSTCTLTHLRRVYSHSWLLFRSRWEELISDYHTSVGSCCCISDHYFSVYIRKGICKYACEMVLKDFFLTFDVTQVKMLDIWKSNGSTVDFILVWTVSLIWEFDF